jgi:hypothetical protein
MEIRIAVDGGKEMAAEVGIAEVSRAPREHMRDECGELAI